MRNARCARRLCVPGLFDIHTHGACGADFSDADFSDGNVLNDIHECNVHECNIHECNEFDIDSFPLDSPLFRLSRYYLSQGVTSFLATTMTLCAEELFAAMHSIDAFCRMRAEFIKRTPKKLHHFAGAKCIGINLEGPFLSSSKRGSQAECNLLAPDAALFHQLNAASGGRIKLVTVAPELPVRLNSFAAFRAAVPFRKATVRLTTTRQLPHFEPELPMLRIFSTA